MNAYVRATVATLAALASLAVPLVLDGGGWHGVAYAQPPSVTVTVDGTDYPVCRAEDCSDQLGQVGVWFDPDTGDAWLSTGRDYSLPITP